MIEIESRVVVLSLQSLFHYFPFGFFVLSAIFSCSSPESFRIAQWDGSYHARRLFAVCYAYSIFFCQIICSFRAFVVMQFVGWFVTVPRVNVWCMLTVSSTWMSQQRRTFSPLLEGTFDAFPFIQTTSEILQQWQQYNGKSNHCFVIIYIVHRWEYIYNLDTNLTKNSKLETNLLCWFCAGWNSTYINLFNRSFSCSSLFFLVRLQTNRRFQAVCVCLWAFWRKFLKVWPSYIMYVYIKRERWEIAARI